MSLSQEIIKDLVMEYKVSNSEITFGKILKRVDHLLLSTIHKHVRRRSLMNIELRDLYHSAIVGLGRAARTSPDNEAPEKVIARIVSYVRLEIDNDYWKKNKLNEEFFVPFDDNKDVEDNNVLSVYDKIESIFVYELLEKAVHEGVITKDECDSFVGRKVYERGYKEIGEKLGLTRDGARKRMLLVEERLMDWMQKQNVF